MTKKQQREIIYNKFDGHCAYCGCLLEKGWHVDELLPVRRKYKYVNSHWKNKITGDKVPILQETDKRDEHVWIPSKYVANGCEHPERFHIDNQVPACAVCNINKHSDTLEDFRKLIENFPRTLKETKVQYRMAIKYGLIIEDIKPVVFYFESVGKNIKNFNNELQSKH
jgi:hypothetical protein